MEYIVRIWIDLKVTANSEEEARELADKTRILVRESKEVESYDSQIANVWERNIDDISNESDPRD